jgi:ATP-dependent Clp protease protease subunit
MSDQQRDGGTGHRHLYLFGELTDEQAKEVVERLVSQWDREHVLFINSDGGSSFSALALVNVLKLHGRVDTVCLGVALSGAADCLAAGRRRLIVPNAIAMIHQVSWDLGHEITANLLKNAHFLDRLNNQLTEMLARDCRQPIERVRADIVTDHYLFGQEIIDYGLADGYFDPAQLPALRPPRRPPRPVPEEFEPRRSRWHHGDTETRRG